MVKSYIPKTYRQALEILYNNELTILAGGTDLMVKTRKWSGLAPDFHGDVLFVAQLQELDYIKREKEHVHIGAAVVLEKLLNHRDIPELLKMALVQMASPGIRHTATLAGNVGNASPAGDSLPVLYILNAVVVTESLDEERHVPIEDFITGPGAKDLRHKEMIKEIIIEDCTFDYILYEKVGGRKSDAISKVSFAGAASSGFDIVTDIRIALGAVAPEVVRVREYESRIIGSYVGDLSRMADLIKEMYEPDIRPINDQRSTAEYRKTCALNVLRKFLAQSEKTMQRRR